MIYLLFTIIFEHCTVTLLYIISYVVNFISNPVVKRDQSGFYKIILRFIKNKMWCIFDSL